MRTHGGIAHLPSGMHTPQYNHPKNRMSFGLNQQNTGRVDENVVNPVANLQCFMVYTAPFSVYHMSPISPNI